MKLLMKIKNWRMERIPKIDRPACIHCRQDMYWNRNRQDWACKPCDDYHFNINGPHDDTDDYGYDEQWDDDYPFDDNPYDDYDDDYPPGYDDYHGPIIG